MGKHTVDFDDYEERDATGYDGDEPKKGIYNGSLVTVKDHTSGAGNEGFEWVFEITEGDFSGWRGWVYSNNDSSKWKTQQIVKAITGGKTDKFVLDTEDNGKKTVKKAKPVRLRVINEKYEDERKGRIRVVLPSDDAAASSKKGKTKNEDEDDPFAD